MAADFELYKLLVEEVRETRKARRELANVFTTLNLGGVGALAFLADDDNARFQPLLLWATVALVLVCLIWRTSNLYYTHLLNAKYTILYEMERDLGSATPLAREYEIMKPNKAMRMFSLERWMPMLFIAGYLVFIVYVNQAPVNVWFDGWVAYLRGLM